MAMKIWLINSNYLKKLMLELEKNSSRDSDMKLYFGTGHINKILGAPVMLI